MAEDELIAIYHKILTNNTARRTVLFLGENKICRATEIINHLKVSPGTFYDALKKLKGLVEKTTDGRYILSELGKKVYYLLLDETSSLTVYPSSSILLNIIYSVPYLFPISLFKMINRIKPVIFLTIIGVTIFFGILGFFISRLVPIIFYAVPFYPFLSSNILIASTAYIINTVFTISLIYFLCTVFGEIKNPLKFSLSLTLVYLPIIIFTYIYYFFYSSFFLTLQFIHYFFIFLLPIFVAFTLLISCIFANVSLRIEAAFFIALVVLLSTFLALEIFRGIVIATFF